MLQKSDNELSRRAPVVLFFEGVGRKSVYVRHSAWLYLRKAVHFSFKKRQFRQVSFTFLITGIKKMSRSRKVRAVCKTGAALSLLAVAGGAYAQSSASQTAAATAFVTSTGGGEAPINTVISQTVTVTGAITANLIGGGVSIFTAAASNPNVTLAGAPRRMALGGQKGEAAAGGGQAWNVWGSLSQNNVGYSFAPVNASGRVNAGTVGLDYTFSNKVILGLAVSGDQTRVGLNGSSVTGNLSGSGTTFTPYVGVPLNQNWTLDAGLGLGRTKVDLTVNNFAGSIKSNRTAANIGLAYRQGVGNWLLTGRGSYLSVNDSLGAYTLSNGVLANNIAIGDSKVRVEQMRFGGQAAYNAGSVVPYIGLNYIYDLKKPNGSAIAGQTPANDRDAFQLQLGLQFKGTGSLYGSVQYSTEQSRQQVKNDQILLNLGLRF